MENLSQTDKDQIEILIAEDEDVIYLLLETILKQKNITTHHAGNGKEAIAIIKKMPHIKLVLMDERMPEMNGFEATAIIKTIYPHIPVIALSALAHEKDYEAAKNAGCVDYIRKPIDFDELFEKISKHLLE